MNALLDKIVADRAKYCCNVKTLGAANIVSPIRHHDFVKDGQRVLLSGDMEMLEAWEKRLDEAKGSAPETVRALQSEAVAELTPLQREVNAKRRALAAEYAKAVERLDALRAKLAK